MRKTRMQSVSCYTWSCRTLVLLFGWNIFILLKKYEVLFANVCPGLFFYQQELDGTTTPSILLPPGTKEFYYYNMSSHSHFLYVFVWPNSSVERKAISQDMSWAMRWRWKWRSLLRPKRCHTTHGSQQTPDKHASMRSRKSCLIDIRQSRFKICIYA
jgi:hypothetical protein